MCHRKKNLYKKYGSKIDTGILLYRKIFSESFFNLFSYTETIFYCHLWVKMCHRKKNLYKKYGSKIDTGILFLYKCMGQKMTHEVLRVLFFSTMFYVKVDILNPYFTKKSCFCIINVPKKYTEILFIQNVRVKNVFSL